LVWDDLPFYEYWDEHYPGGKFEYHPRLPMELSWLMDDKVREKKVEEQGKFQEIFLEWKESFLTEED